MKESATIALSYIRAHAEQLGIDLEQLKDREIHIHVPEGAIPKDGPSAGITMVTSLVSAITRRKVRPHLAMTGEITLRGKVLPVGGIKEKILAAKRSGITDIILCRENEKDILEINERYLDGLTFHYVDEISEVLSFALLDERAGEPNK
jgi:lon protease